MLSPLRNFQAAGNKAERERGWSDEGNFFGLTIQQLRREVASIVQKSSGR